MNVCYWSESEISVVQPKLLLFPSKQITVFVFMGVEVEVIVAASNSSNDGVFATEPSTLCAVPFNLHIRIVKMVLYVSHFIGEGILRKVQWLLQNHTASKWQGKGLRLSFLVTNTHAVLRCSKENLANCVECKSCDSCSSHLS